MAARKATVTKAAGPRAWLLAAALACGAPAAWAIDLVEALHAAQRNDLEHAVARATRDAAQPRRDQATALWLPKVNASAAAGWATRESETHGAQFSAPGFGTSNNVDFSTSVNGGSAGRWTVSAVQPLYSPERSAQRRVLELSVELAEQQWQAAQQALILRTAQRYFELALAQESLRVARRQLEAVRSASTEAQDRFALGATPVTDTYETGASLAGVQARVLALESEASLKQQLLADSTGLPADGLVARLPAARPAAPPQRPLEDWLTQARSGNPEVRMRELAAELARREAEKYSLQSSIAVELVAQASMEKLSGSGDFGSASNRASEQMIGLQVSIPLYAGGMRSARQDEALRLADKAATEADRSRQLAAQELRAAWLGLRTGAERVRALAEGLRASEARLDATRLGRQVGDRSTLDLLNAHNDAAAARLALAQARTGLLLDRLHLQALAGQLDEQGLRAVNEELAPADQHAASN